MNPSISRTNRSFSGRHILTGLATVVLIILIIVVVRSGDSKSTPSISANTSAAAKQNTAASKVNPYSVLAPATVASKTAECTQAITYNSDGTSGPVACSNGDLNVTEWNALSALEPKVMSLGYSASITQVESAICSDASDSASDESTTDSNLIESTTYQISAMYYGWNFSTSPTSVLTNSSC
jgi:hypothetical protein